MFSPASAPFPGKFSDILEKAGIPKEIAKACHLAQSTYSLCGTCQHEQKSSGQMVPHCRTCGAFQGCLNLIKENQNQKKEIAHLQGLLQDAKKVKIKDDETIAERENEINGLLIGISNQQEAITSLKIVTELSDKALKERDQELQKERLKSETLQITLNQIIQHGEIPAPPPTGSPSDLEDFISEDSENSENSQMDQSNTAAKFHSPRDDPLKANEKNHTSGTDEAEPEVDPKDASMQTKADEEKAKVDPKDIIDASTEINIEHNEELNAAAAEEARKEAEEAKKEAEEAKEKARLNRLGTLRSSETLKFLQEAKQNNCSP